MGNTAQKTPIHREDDGELLGFVVQDSSSWQAQTIFGYLIERTTNKVAAEAVVRERGLAFLMGVWHYLDKDDDDWHACVLKEAYEHQVTVLRTTAMGYQDPDDYKIVTINDPSETNLVKS
jgi:hypothetical protein